MPLQNGVGYGDHSAAKQDDFHSLLSLHVGIVDRMTNKPGKNWQRRYTFIDMNAGPGCYDGLIGSPLIFLEEIEKTTIPYRAVFIEREAINADALRDNVGLRSLRHQPLIINDSHANVLRKYIKSQAPKTYGLIYHDPSGSVPDFDLLSDASRAPILDYMEFMIYLSATNIKRVRRFQEATNRDAKVKLLIDSLQTINKKTWIIRKPQGRHQWTFVLGSNWSKFPEWEKRGFYRIDSPVGQEILRSLTYTDKELEGMSGQQSFFDLPELQTSHTEIMRST